jgi:hypothetical protein
MWVQSFFEALESLKLPPRLINSVVQLPSESLKNRVGWSDDCDFCKTGQHGCAGMFFKVFLPVVQLRLFFLLDTWYVTPGVLN